MKMEMYTIDEIDYIINQLYILSDRSDDEEYEIINEIIDLLVKDKE